MRILKTIAVVLIVLIAGYVIWAAMSPSKMNISESIEINKDKSTCYSLLVNFNENRKWNPFSKSDPDAKNEITGDGTAIGDSWTWDGKKVGKGILKHLDLIEGELIHNKLTFMTPWESTAEDTFKVTETEGKTMLTWTTVGNENLPFFMRPIMPMMLKGEFRKGLADFKKIAEETPSIAAAKPELKIEESKVGDMKILTIRDKCAANDISQKLGELYGEIGECLKKSGAKMAGAPFAIYYSYSKDKGVELEAGFAVDKKVTGSGRVKYSEMKGGKVVVAHHYGSYEDTEKAHMKIDEYMKSKNITATGAPWESYVTDPTTVKSPNEVLTDIYYPVK